jgi:hypothetical protein
MNQQGTRYFGPVVRRPALLVNDVEQDDSPSGVQQPSELVDRDQRF